jgi:hypothetical protein
VGDVLAHARAIADTIAGGLPAGYLATEDVRAVRPPCVLVLPVPARRYDLTGCAWAATWTIFALAVPPGDLAAAAQLELMADVIGATVDGVTGMEAAAYTIPGVAESSPLPGYRITVESEEKWQ